MRVLFYLADREWSGRARTFAALARGFRDRGHQVTVTCPPDSPLEGRLDPTAYEVLPLDPDGPWMSAAARLRRALLDRFVEVVCVHSAREQLVAAAAARWAERAAVVRRVPHGHPVVLGAGERFALRLAATGFVFGSDAALREAPPLPGTRLEPAVVPVGVDLEAHRAAAPLPRQALGLEAGHRVVVCLYGPGSRLHAATVLRVVALLAPRHPELRLLLVGPGTRDDELRMHAAALRITRRVQFLGERGDLLPLLRAADLGWVVAQGDDGAYGMLDCGAVGLPPVAERTPLAGEYVADRITGVLLPPADPPDTAAEVARLLALEEDRAAMGSAAQARVAREFTEQRMVDAFERVALAAADRSRW